MSKLKVIFIDWNKTLSVSEFWEQLKYSHPQIQLGIKNALFDQNSPLKKLINPWMTNQLNSNDVVKILSSHLDQDPSFLLNELYKSCAQMKFITPQTPLLINELKKKGFKVVLASDNMDCFSKYTVTALKLNNLFDDLLISCNLKAVKDDFDSGRSSFFSDYLDANKLQPSECVLIDDSITTKNLESKNGLNYLLIEENKNINYHLQNLLER